MLKIAITGGPCAGKTEAMGVLPDMLAKHGYKVMVISETATELANSGVRSGDEMTHDAFEELVYDLQLEKEAIYTQAAMYFGNDVIILCDRGLPDNKVYMTDAAWTELLSSRGTDEKRILSRYDAAIHMTTTAKGAEGYYLWNDPESDDPGNNAARFESLDEARENDDRAMAAWEGHPRFRIVDNSTGFVGKVRRVLDEILAIAEDEKAQRISSDTDASS